MRFSTRSRYGLRALVLIATKEGAVTSSEMVSSCEGISKKYLDRILMQLREAGLLRSVKGQGGGYVLARSPDDIRANEVIEALEGDLCLVACVGDPSLCLKVDTCETRRVWCRIASVVRDALHSVSLSSLVESRRALKRGHLE